MKTMLTKNLLFAVLLSCPGLARAQAPAAPAAALTAVLGPVFGSAQYQQGGADVWFFAKPGRSLPPKTTVKTEAGSYCLLFLSDGTKLRLGPRSNVGVEDLSPARATLSLNSGRLESWVKKREGTEFRLVTPLFTATLAEGSFAAGILSPTGATLDIFTGDPTVVDGLGKSHTVSPGNRVEFDAKTGASTPAPLPASVLRPREPGFSGPARPAAVKEAAPAPAPKKPEAKPAPAAPVKPDMDNQL